jgi:hypothetical protein
MHAFAAILSQPIDIAHSVVAIMIGLAGGAFLAELRLKPLARALARKPKAAPRIDHGGPWG